MTQVFVIVLAIAVAIAASIVFILLDHLWRYDKSADRTGTRSGTGEDNAVWYEKPRQQLRA